MDKVIYTAMTGAKHVFLQQANAANNLANASTVGFKSSEHQFRAVPIQSEAMPTRAFVVDTSTSENLTPGPLMVTGRTLDMIIQGKGWFAVQANDGSEAYTRAGNFQIDPNGNLVTATGNPVLSDSGPISIPPDNEIEVGADGTISVIPSTGAKTLSTIVGRIKMVNPAETDIVRREDGLFQTRSGNAADVDDTIRISSGALEGSNVNVTDAMVNMVSLARQFEMQIKLIQTAEQNAQKADQILGNY